jgi:PIN domain nuclease of toxin-antitoxin system
MILMRPQLKSLLPLIRTYRVVQVLLDTNALLWWMKDDERLGPVARKLISEGTNLVVVTPVSVWEWHIKARLGKLSPEPALLSLIEKQNFTLANYAAEDAHGVKELPELPWKDPFDMAIMAQAIRNTMPLLTSDRNILAVQIPGLIVIDARK